MKIEVERGVPLPPIMAGRNAIYPLKVMEVGDSFRVEKWVNIKRINTDPTKEFLCRRDLSGNHRVWRVK